MNAISPAPINSDLYFHEMHKLDKDPESKASYRGGRGDVWQQHNYMPVEEMAAKWKQFDKLQWLEVSISISFYLFFKARPSAGCFSFCLLKCITIKNLVHWQICTKFILIVAHLYAH